jgi:amidase
LLFFGSIRPSPSRKRIVDSALQSGYVRNTKYAEKFDSERMIGQEKGVARLKNPIEHLKNYIVKLQPMLGCIAVAPPHTRQCTQDF